MLQGAAGLELVRVPRNLWPQTSTNHRQGELHSLSPPLDIDCCFLPSLLSKRTLTVLHVLAAPLDETSHMKYPAAPSASLSHECAHAQSLSHVWLSCNTMDYSPPGSSVHGFSQASILEWIAISSFRGSSQTWDQTHIPCIGKRILYHWATREAPFPLGQQVKIHIYSRVGLFLTPHLPTQIDSVFRPFLFPC